MSLFLTLPGTGNGDAPPCRKERHPGLTALISLIAAVTLLPIATLVAIALSGSGGIWSRTCCRGAR
jgi:hypothetical protein